MSRNRHKVVKTPQSQQVWEEVADKVADKIPADTKVTQFQGGHKVSQKSKLQLRTQQIAIGIPMDEVLFSQFFTNFLGIGVMPWDTLITTQSTYLPMARNQVHDQFLEEGGGTHLFMLDSDVLPPPGIILSLLKHDKHMVGGWYRKKEKFWVKTPDGQSTPIQRPVVYDLGDKGGFIQRIQPGQGFEKVAAAGAGCWLMSRELAEKLGESPYDMEGGGEDMNLCRRVTELGYDIYIDWSLPCAHMGVFWV